MTTIRTTCPACGEIDLHEDEIGLTHDLHHYVYQCPRCGVGVAKKTDSKIVRLLQSAGVVTLSPEVKVMERQRFPGRPPLTIDDVIDFGLNFDREMEQLLEMEGA